jgi:hypothetical protein
VPRLRSLLAAGLAGLLVAVGPVACGDDDADESQRAAPGAEVAPPRLSRSDREAFAEIQRASGALRAAAIAVAYGSAPRIAEPGRLRAVARELAAIVPRDSLLRRLRRRTIKALRTAASEEGTPPKDVAKAAIAEADRIDAGLRRYAASHPAANEIAPG